MRPPGRHTVYIGWQGADCLYVGCTSNLKARLSEHRSQSRWLALVDAIDFHETSSGDEGYSLEAELIQQLRPTHNRVGMPRPDLSAERAASPVITSAQAAEILGKSQRTIQRLVASGALEPELVILSGYLFNRADVEALAKAAA